ncbi:MAG: hypothetical protein LBC74_14500 [Planctomycetaceae bacterium]|nr:hypothetical protein [Planctomycetaceae bacterium]
MANKKTPPSEANNSPPSEGSVVVSYRLAKRSSTSSINCEQFQSAEILQIFQLLVLLREF